MALVIANQASQGQGIAHIPLGVASALKEALRTCQLSPSGDWPLPAYELVGRNDLAEGLNNSPAPLFHSGYRSVKDYIVSTHSYAAFLFYVSPTSSHSHDRYLTT